jgi:branched-chain amino acid transport system ATP-binding protein
MALLTTHNLTAHYGDFQALFGVDIDLNEGETIAIIGANGAGKTTLMRSIAGVLINDPGDVSFDGTAIGNATADAIMAMGVAMVPEGRRLFPSLVGGREPADRHIRPQNRRPLDPGNGL